METWQNALCPKAVTDKCHYRLKEKWLHYAMCTDLQFKNSLKKSNKQVCVMHCVFRWDPWGFVGFGRSSCVCKWQTYPSIHQLQTCISPEAKKNSRNYHRKSQLALMCDYLSGYLFFWLVSAKGWCIQGMLKAHHTSRQKHTHFNRWFTL